MQSGQADDTILLRPKARSGTIVIPDHFLRRWDPVTVFFTSAVGPILPGPEDTPAKFVEVSPRHPGAFTWLDSRTLQFRPAEPWPPLTRFSWRVQGNTTHLTTLMSVPNDTIPVNNAEELPEVESISMTFPEPLDIVALRNMITIELRSLLGDEQNTRWLEKEDFEIKAKARQNRNDSATYILQLHHPIPLLTRAIVHLRLSLDDDATESFSQLNFATAKPFRATAMGCGQHRFPITPSGSRLTKDQVLNCGSTKRAVFVDFSTLPEAIDPIKGRNLVRFSPAVKNLSYSTNGSTLEINGSFDWETIYRVPIPMEIN